MVVKEGLYPGLLFRTQLIFLLIFVPVFYIEIGEIGLKEMLSLKLCA
jgi:hypothetical protein